MDTCSAIVGQEPVRVQAVACGEGERSLQSDLAVQLEYETAVASITYATGGSPKVPKERIEILGRGSILAIDDFRTVEVDGRSLGLKGQDKGHSSQVRAFRASLDEAPSEVGIGSMRVTLHAAASLLG